MTLIAISKEYLIFPHSESTTNRAIDFHVDSSCKSFLSGWCWWTPSLLERLSKAIVRKIMCLLGWQYRSTQLGKCLLAYESSNIDSTDRDLHHYGISITSKILPKFATKDMCEPKSLCTEICTGIAPFLGMTEDMRWKEGPYIASP